MKPKQKQKRKGRVTKSGMKIRVLESLLFALLCLAQSEEPLVRLG